MILNRLKRREALMRGVLDRFADRNQAVILIEEKNEEWIVPIDQLPEGSQEGTYFKLTQEQGAYQILSIDEKMTLKQGKVSKNLNEKLRARQKESKFKRRG